jgi:uncharacterized protein (DUF58 family)
VRFFFHIFYRFYRAGSGFRYRVRRRFTPAGLLVLGALVMAAIMGPDTDNNIAYQGFAILVCLLLVSIAFTAWFRARFTIRRLLPRFGTVGAPLAYDVRVRNLTRKPQKGLLLLENLADLRPAFDEWLAAHRAEEKHLRSLRLGRTRPGRPHRWAELKEATLPDIPPGHELQVRTELTPLRRGPLRFDGVTFARPDPLGLCHAFTSVSQPQSVLILPRRYPLPAIALPGTLKYQEGGIALASHIGQSEEFVSLRDYRHGDPLRHIHWRSWAKVGMPVVKEFQDEFFVRHALILDTFTDHPRSEACEEAISIAASFACTLQTQESLLDLLFVGPNAFCITTGRGLAHADQMLEVLASVRPCHDKPFDELEHLVLNHVAAVSGCVCIFLAWDPSRRRLVEKLQALGLPLVVLVVLERGENLQLDSGPMRADPANFHVLEAGKIEPGLARLT